MNEDKILEKLEEIDQKLTEYVYQQEEEKKRINIEDIRMPVPWNVRTLAIPLKWIKYEFHYFDNAPYRYVLKIDPSAFPGDGWLKLEAWLHGEVLISENEKEVDLGTAKIKEICTEDQKDITIEGKYLTFEQTEGIEWKLTKNAAEAYVYRLVLKNYTDWCVNDVGNIEISNAFDYKAICIEPLRELRLYMILPIRETTKISIEHQLGYDDFIVSWNNGDPYVVKAIKNEV